jgi:hypothetical protein
MQQALYSHFSDRYAVVFEALARSWEGAESNRRIDALLVRRAAADPAAAKRNVTAAAGVLAAGLGAEFIGGDSLFPAPPPVDPGDHGGLERIAVEIKVSRQDFKSDVVNPAKQAPWRELAHRHAYAVPAGLVGVAEVPRESGLLVVSEGGSGRFTVEWAKRAPKAATARPLSLGQILDAFYRWSRAEAAAKGFTGQDRGRDPESLRLDNARLRAELDRARGLAERRSEKISELQKRIAAFEPLPCATCGRQLRPARPRKADTGLVWEHVAADEVVCLELRTAVAQAEHDREVAEAEVRYGKDGRTPAWMRERSLCVWPPLPVYPGDGDGADEVEREALQRLVSQTD